jgi:hypothetical protein
MEKYITSVEGYRKFDDNFIAEIHHNFEISVTGGLDKTLYTKILSETDIELMVEKYQDSLTAACKKSFYERKEREKKPSDTSRYRGGRQSSQL